MEQRSFRDDEELCQVCQDGSSDDDNRIIFCDKCNLAVHQDCYGVEDIPEGRWFCRTCEYGINRHALKCALCGHAGGVFKPTTTNDWAHILCGIWLPDVSFTHPHRLEKIDTTLMNRDRINLKCCVCGLKKKGPCVQCPVGKCAQSFHPWCLLTRPHPDVFTPPGEYEAYCKKHSPAAEERYRQEVELMGDEDGGPLRQSLSPTRPAGGMVAVANSKQSMGLGAPFGPAAAAGIAHRLSNASSSKAHKGQGYPPPHKGLSGGCRTTSSSSSTDRAMGGGKGKGWGVDGELDGGGGGGGDTWSTANSTAGMRDGSSTQGNGLVVPLWSEWPGQQMNEAMDLDHFWSVVSMYFPERIPPDTLAKLRSLVLPVTDPIDDDPIFRMPRLRPQASRLPAAAHSDGSGDEGQSVWGLDSLADQFEEDGNLSDASYEGQDVAPGDVTHMKTRGRHELGTAVGGKDLVNGVLTDLTLNEPQVNAVFLSGGAVAVCHFRHGSEQGLVLKEVSASPVLAPLPTAQVELQVDMAEPNELEIELMSHQQELRMTGAKLVQQYDSIMTAKTREAERHEERRLEWASIEQSYIRAKTWRMVATGLSRGMQDRPPDFNKRHEEALPASWTVPVEGRPRPEDLAAATGAARGGVTGASKAAGLAGSIGGVTAVDEDDSICMVCFDGTSHENNEIVFCDGCNVAVHQACYGLAEIPEGDFYCDRCTALMDDSSRPIVCAICPEAHGGFKRTVDGRWVHLSCALLCPGSCITNLADMGPVDISSAVILASATGARLGTSVVPPSAVLPPSISSRTATESHKQAAEAPAAEAGPDDETRMEQIGTDVELADTASALGNGLGHPATQLQDGPSSAAGSSRSIAHDDAELPSSATEAADVEASKLDDNGTQEKGGQGTSDVPGECCAKGPLTPNHPEPTGSQPEQNGPLSESVRSVEAATGAVVRFSQGGAVDALRCMLCKQARGYTHVCSHDQCTNRFHLLCAWFRGAYVSVTLTDKSYLGAGKDQSCYPTGLKLEAYCSLHCPPGKRDRIEQIRLRTFYRLKEEAKRVHKKRSVSVQAEGPGKRVMKGAATGQRKDLMPDVYDGISCAICMHPKAPFFCSPTSVDTSAASLEEATVECDRCDLSVHVSCYKEFHGKEPSGAGGSDTWVCETCLASDDEPVPCVLCPRRGGLMVPTTDRNVRWAHAFCSLNTPTSLVFKAGPNTHADPLPSSDLMEALPKLVAMDVRNLTKDPRKTKCSICGRKGGVCISCAAVCCSVQFHPICARLAGWYFECSPTGGRPKVLCPGHLPDGMFRCPNGQYVDMKGTHRLRKNLDRARLLLDLIRRREKLKRMLWKSECEMSEERLDRLRALLTGRQEQLNRGRRMTDDRLAKYRQEVDALRRSAPLHEEGMHDVLIDEWSQQQEPDDSPPASPSVQDVAAEGVKRKLSVRVGSPVLASDGGTASHMRRSNRAPTAAAADAVVSSSKAHGGEEGVEGKGGKRGKRPRDSRDADADKKGARSAEVASPVNRKKAITPKQQKPFKPGAQRNDAEHDEAREDEEGSPKRQKTKKSESNVRVVEEDTGERDDEDDEEEDDTEYMLDRFEALADTRALDAATQLTSAGAWAMPGLRLAGCPRADFEKALGLVIPPEHMRRREGRGPRTNQEESRVSLDRQLMELFSALQDCKDSSGEPIDGTFDISPDPEQYPDYYEKIDSPMDFETIRHRVQIYFYDSLADFIQDVHLLIRNAKKYNEARSSAYQDAELLRTYFEAKRNDLQDKVRVRAMAAADGGHPNLRRLASMNHAPAADTAAPSKGKRGGKRKQTRGGGAAVCHICSPQKAAAGHPTKFCEACVIRIADAFLGLRVDVLWPDDAVWYPGRIHDFDATSNQHRILYEDGEWEFVHLAEQDIRYVDTVIIPPAPGPPESQVLGVDARSSSRSQTPVADGPADESSLDDCGEEVEDSKEAVGGSKAGQQRLARQPGPVPESYTRRRNPPDRFA